MPEKLQASEVEKGIDPTVAKQYDTETPIKEQVSDLYGIVDKLKSCLLTTERPGVGPVSRSMAIAKRVGPDFLFIANYQSQKFTDLDNNKTAQVTFQDSSSQNWVSITGKAVTTSNDDPRIKELYSKGLMAWFGDLGDGKHTGKPDDPRMALIEVKAHYIAYWKSEVSSLGFAKEVGVGAMTGQVANVGTLREMKKDAVEKMREMTE